LQKSSKLAGIFGIVLKSALPWDYQSMLYLGNQRILGDNNVEVGLS